MKIEDIKINPRNPRIIRNERFISLKQSLQEFPKMMELRPIIIDKEGYIIGGNMRYRALKELGYTEIPDKWIKRADRMSAKERKKFIVVDNLPYGENDYDILANEWDAGMLRSWGMELPYFDDVDMLSDDNFQSKGEATQKSITFTYEKEYYNIILKYLEKNKEGKNYLRERLLEHCKEEVA